MEGWHDWNKNVMHVVRYLARQGLSLRDESDSNFVKLLKFMAQFDPLEEWLKRKDNVYTSAVIQNEMIKIMALHILRDLASILQSTPFLTIMVDETTD